MGPAPYDCQEVELSALDLRQETRRPKNAYIIASIGATVPLGAYEEFATVAWTGGEQATRECW